MLGGWGGGDTLGEGQMAGEGGQLDLVKGWGEDFSENTS